MKKKITEESIGAAVCYILCALVLAGCCFLAANLGTPRYADTYINPTIGLP